MLCISGSADLKQCLDLGARVDVRDTQGRTMLHDAVRSGNSIKFKLKYLIEIGVDLNIVDYSGHNLFHEAILSFRQDLEMMEDLDKLGLDIDQVNNSGLTPMHILCSIGEEEPFLPDSKMFISWVLQKSKNLDAMDHNGITSLHLASTISEFYVDQLLKLGADPTTPSYEGLTALHLAAQARQSNIVGMLVNTIPPEDASGLRAFVNAQDQNGRTALHHACRSGRPETVAILLDSGADLGIIDHKQCTVVDACAEFEDEQELWRGWRKLTPPEGEEPSEGDLVGPHMSTCGFNIGDTSRPYVSSGKALNEYFGYHVPDVIHTCQDTARLNGILDMIFSRANNPLGWLTESIDRSISKAKREGHSYTLRCLDGFRSKIHPTEGTNEPHQIADEENSIFSMDNMSLGINSQVVSKDWTIKQLPEAYEGETQFAFLAKHGLADTLKCWRVHHTSLDTGTSHTLLHIACMRELPNMDVIRFLVEKLSVDVNVQNRSEVDEDGDPLPGGSTALQLLARGYHWWQAEYPIRFLVTEGGVDLELCNDKGQTALQIALDSNGTFNKQAAQTLIDLGAKLESSSQAQV